MAEHNRHPLPPAHTLRGQQRAQQKGQKPCVIWFTGLSGAGKSTLANALEQRLFALGHHSYVLDGDLLRQGLNRDLSFTAADRVENIRRVGEVSKLLVDAGLIVLAAFISPFVADRNAVRALLREGEFVEVYLEAPLAVCEARDTKGLYAKARAGLIAHFTGISAPYEVPPSPELRLDSSQQNVAHCVEALVTYLQSSGRINPGHDRT